MPSQGIFGACAYTLRLLMSCVVTTGRWVSSGRNVAQLIATLFIELQHVRADVTEL
jgi:hypothetical protein